VFSNPWNKTYLRMDLAIWVFSIVLGCVFLILNSHAIIVFIVMVFIGFIWYFVNWQRQCYYRPIEVEIQEDGILMTFRYSSKLQLKWNEILGIYSSRDESAWIANPYGTGIIIPKKGTRRDVTFEIAEAIASKYHERTVHDLPREGVYEKDRDFKRRLGY